MERSIIRNAKVHPVLNNLSSDMISITCISDLHGFQPSLPGGDLLLIAGDLTARNTFDEYERFKLAALGKTVIFDIEKGKLSIRLDTLLKVLEVLNIKIEFQSQLMALFKENVE